MTGRRSGTARARDLASQLDLDVGETGICYACLSFVAFPLDAGRDREAVGEARRMAPILWDEGLAEPALASVRRACSAGVPGAEIALADLERRGGYTLWAQAIVLRLAADLMRRARTELRLEEAARDRLLLAPPELN